MYQGQPGWENELKDDLISECSQYGDLVHIYVDSASEHGNVYVKCPSITAAVSSVNALHGRFYAGKCHAHLLYCRTDRV